MGSAPAPVGADVRIVVVDLETTGLDPVTDKVVEIGMAAVSDHEYRWELIRDEAGSLVNPGMHIPPEASAVHHIVDQDVADAPSFDEAIDRVLGRLDEIDVIAAHNCRFDMGFLPMLKGKRWIDTYRCAMHVWPDAPAFSLQVLRYWLNLAYPSGPTHRAVDDATIAAMILIRLLDGRSVEDLLRLSTKAVELRKVGFGKYFGWSWYEVPIDYLRWAEFQDFDPDVMFTIKKQLQRRKIVS